MEWEAGLIEGIQGALGDIGAFLGKAFTLIGGEMGIPLVLVIILFCWKKETGERIVMTLAAVNTWLPMLKSAVLRPRPYMEYPGRIKADVTTEAVPTKQEIASQGYSFPSMHSASAAAVYVSAAKEAKKRWIWSAAVALTILVGISRVMLGMHYPTDVLAGWTAGIAGAGIMYLLEKTVRKDLVRYLILLATALPGLIFVRTEDYYTSLGMMAGFFAAIAYDRKYVRYQDTRSVPAMILRTAGGFTVYFALNTLLKLPFSNEFLGSAGMGAFLVRAARYAVTVFAVFGLYPRLFPWFEKIGKGSRGQEDGADGPALDAAEGEML